MSLRARVEVELARRNPERHVHTLHTHLCTLLEPLVQTPITVHFHRGTEAMASFCSALFNVCESTGVKFDVSIVMHGMRRAALFRATMMEHLDSTNIMQLNDDVVRGRHCGIHSILCRRTLRGVSGDILLVDDADKFGTDQPEVDTLVTQATQCLVPVLLTLSN